jgi:lipopolysaccharide biosynthesis glycosyltransferase
LPDETIVVAYCFDRNYAPFAAVSTHSLLKHSKSKFRIYWCTGEADAEYARELARTLAEKVLHEPIVVALNAEHVSNWRTSHGGRLASHYSTATFFRLLLPDALPEDRIIYIDCDTIVQSDLAEIFALDMGGKYIGAVPDRWASLAHRMPLAEGEPYVNAGLMVLDLARLREDNFLEKCKLVYQAHSHELMFVDQCIINKYAEGQKLILPGKWNRLILAGSRIAKHFEGVQDAGLVHFVSAIKPWQAKSDPGMSALWWSYAKELDLPELSRLVHVTASA